MIGVGVSEDDLAADALVVYKVRHGLRVTWPSVGYKGSSSVVYKRQIADVIDTLLSIGLVQEAGLVTRLIDRANKNEDEFDPGYFYCPYVPIVMVSGILSTVPTSHAVLSIP